MVHLTFFDGFCLWDWEFIFDMIFPYTILWVQGYIVVNSSHAEGKDNSFRLLITPAQDF